MRRTVIPIAAALLSLMTGHLTAQSLGNAGTIQGTVADPTGATVSGASVSLTNPISGYKQQAKSGADGTFRLSNIPPNSYHLEIRNPGFSTYTQDISVKTAVPLQIAAKLALASETTSVTVEGGGADVLGK